MKIGILTHPLDYNYGCLLQAFALQKTLADLGHEVITINRYTNPHKSFFYLFKNWCARFVRRVLYNADVSLVWNPTETLSIKKKLSVNTQKFVDRNIVNTGIILPNELSRIDNEYKFDAYVVGSDQVWLPHFCPNSFLDFVSRENVIKIFYAASSGKESFANYPKLAKKCSLLAQKFAGISVREESLIRLSKRSLDRDATLVLDPTLLLKKEDYLSACVEKEESSPAIFTYILDKSNNKFQLIDRVQKELKLPVVSGTVELDYVKGRGINIDSCVYPSVDHWINSLSRARFVVTDSFHGTCMSILFNKPFVVIGNEARGYERFISLLSLFNLNERLINNTESFNVNLFNELPYEEINQILSKKREASLTFIKQYIS